ncbi:hypothetical protein RI129_002877 [Pyrocoelia pectoralis]|uniref:Uncharacterized protein n=1 Tax=Pyrocoelia pectoralis TaxID=417401 RepID=A0AAN7VGT9_9COLE
MHADRASYNGKNDPVICQYGEDYLRKHKRPHIRNAVSNKIRELGRLLIPLQDIYGISTLLEAINTKHYEKVVHAAQIISGYDNTLKTFKAPSLALHLKGILLGACLAAKTLLLKQDPILPVVDYNESLKIVKQFRSLVDERWKFDMASLALKDLNEKQGKTYQTLPITSDVIKFRKYAVEVAEENLNILKENVSNRIAFKKLTEAALVLTVLLNRKRVGDVQYIKVDSYTQVTTSTNQEECLNALSESEKLLSAHFKRIITIGKGSRSIPVLFPKNVETYVDTLLTTREKNGLIPKENPFLFALIGSKGKWMDGSSVLRKYAASCGAENPKTLTSSRLRKQIATVLQVLNLNDTEKEQMASFMGHTMKTHSEFYRLPQEVYQTAKIAKLLLIMDKGKGAEFQGKALEEIDVQLERLNEESSEKMDSDIESNNEEKIQGTSLNEENNEFDFSSQPNEGNTQKKGNMLKECWEGLRRQKIPNRKTGRKEIVLCKRRVGKGTSNVGQKEDKKERKGGQRGSWNNKQKNIMKEFFKKHLSKKITPKKHECLQLQNSYKDMFKDKTWVQIKVFIYNSFQQQRQ